MNRTKKPFLSLSEFHNLYSETLKFPFFFQEPSFSNPISVLPSPNSQKPSSNPSHALCRSAGPIPYLKTIMAALSLPPSVEEMLQRICRERSLPLPEPMALEKLCSLGQGPSLDILQEISRAREIRNLTAFIIHMAGKASQTEPARESVCTPGPQNSFSGHRQYKNEPRSSPVSPKNPRADEASSSLVSPKKPWTQIRSPHLQALGELEFDKAFLILSYIGKKELEDVLSLDSLERLKNLPMARFESELWEVVGRKCLPETDRRKNLDWDSKKARVYQCHVDQDGKFTFKGPYLQNKRTHLQRVLGDDNILNVRFADLDESRHAARNALYHCIAKEGILVGLRHYHFFVFKDGGKEEKKKNPTSSPVKCYFVCTESNATLDERRRNILFGKLIQEARCLFMHVHTVPNMAKYMARFNLILSKTTKVEIDFGSVDIKRIDDTPCLDEEGKPVYKEGGGLSIHTDGTGFISEDLAMKCQRNVHKGEYFIREDLERILDQAEVVEKSSTSTLHKSVIGDPPLLIQFRLFHNGCAVKGTLLLNKKLPPNTIQIRPSMIKVETDPKLSNVQSVNSLEIVSTSNRPRKTYLNKTLISLLNYGGVPKEYFMDLLRNALNNAQNVRSNKHIALRVALNHGDLDDFLALRMILCGIPLDEPYLKAHLSVLMREELKNLKEGRLHASECYYLMGTADPTGMLKADEVCVILDNGQISGDILVYKAPGLHFGDIHVVTATYIRDLENFVGNSKYAIFFPTKGPRSLADEMANSDFDGDMYWVSRNPELLDHFKASKPWEPVSSKSKVQQRKPSEFSAEELERELFQQFLVNRFEPSYAKATAADSWMSFMDRLLTLGDECAQEKDCLKEKMIELIDIYYDALDASKTGLKVEVPKILTAEKFPHYMERCNPYNSKSILGMIYDEVDSFKEEDEPTEEVWELPCFSGEIPNSCLMQWKERYREYRTEMTCAMSMVGESKDSAANEIIQKYKRILYGAAEFEESRRNRGEIFSEALAIYRLSYDYAKKTSKVRRCGFAWKVAGRALCQLHAIKQNESSILCLPSVLREVLNRS
ncbi:probable RNA-dependent RNA polymerase 5 isoform X2 [Magnolia sinica]|uniref:probable RNA-dependent RNA polymerase 5 isoform X2 n=1 Tax=Magnolia sinica TaxID=86752 RepID=UPI002659BF57|nr:probable RNA-dependent RNA polymerase 5 isoform X2 [Magnolia sinica]